MQNTKLEELTEKEQHRADTLNHFIDDVEADRDGKLNLFMLTFYSLRDAKATQGHFYFHGVDNNESLSKIDLEIALCEMVVDYAIRLNIDIKDVLESISHSYINRTAKEVTKTC